MAHVTAYFVRGTPLLSPPDSNEDYPVLDWIAKLGERSKFTSPDPSEDLKARLAQAPSRWEYLVGDFTADAFRIRVYRYFPYWCFEVHYEDQEAIQPRITGGT